MKVQYLLFLFAAIVIVAVASYCITGPVQGRKSEQNSISTPMGKTKHFGKTEPLESAKKDSVTINGIAYSGSKAAAIIEGKIVQEGDEINNIKILRIYENEIELEQNGKTWRQQVNDPNKNAAKQGRDNSANLNH